MRGRNTKRKSRKIILEIFSLKLKIKKKTASNKRCSFLFYKVIIYYYPLLRSPVASPFIEM